MLAGLAAGFLIGSASIATDALYFDVRNFYLQNKEDYIRQPRAQLKQAILQHLHNKKEAKENWALNERLFFRSDKHNEQKAITLRGARESIFFLEAVDKDEK
jgi:hypothetical protein